MRAIAQRKPAAGLATVALAVTLVACTGHGDEDRGRDRSGVRSDKPVAEACQDGTFTWFNVVQRERLTGVAEAELVGEGGKKLTNRLERVYTPETSVKADGPSLPTRKVLFSLGQRVGVIDDEDIDSMDEAAAFLDVNQKAPELNGGAESTTILEAAEVVRYAAVKTVEGDFRYSCSGGETTVGQAKSWEVHMSGTATCGHAPDPDADVAMQAVLFACDKDSVAAKAAARTPAKG